MATKRHKPEEIVSKLRQVEVLVGQGMPCIDAIRMVLEHEGEHPSRWAVVSSIAAKIGCAPATLHEWVKKAEAVSGKRAGLLSDVTEKMKAPERENRELRQAHEILRKAFAYFTMGELNRPLK